MNYIEINEMRVEQALHKKVCSNGVKILKWYSATLVIMKMQIKTMDDFRHPPDCLQNLK